MTNSTPPTASNGDQLTLVYEARRQRDHAIRHVETGSDQQDTVLARVKTVDAPDSVRRLGDGTCWLWVAGLNNRGYGTAWNGEVSVPAHRWSYELLVGPIPPGLELDHLCKVRRCVAPHHLEPVTRAENVRRGDAPELARQRAAQITHCPEGHPYDEANTYRAGGRRHCRQCMTRRSREWARRNVAAKREAARQARDAAIEDLEAGSDDWSRAVIDQAIREVAARGVPFSANDVRPLLPQVRPALIGARFLAASRNGLIRRVGYVQSTDPATHAHPVAEWVRA